MPFAKNQILRLSIESISSDGSGVARSDGMVVFVPGAAVGDVLDVKLVKLAKSHAFGIIHQVVTPGPGRQKPDCPIAGRCGGCAFRHLTYAAELDAKHSFVADALRRIGGLEVEVPPVLPSPVLDCYRNKVQYPVAAAADGDLAYGFYAARSHRVIPCGRCLLQPQLMNDIAAYAVKLLGSAGVSAYDETTGKGLVRHLVMRQSTQSGQVLLCLVLAKNRFAGAQDFAEAMAAAFPQIAGVVLNLNPARTNVILGDAQADRMLYGGAVITDALCGVPLTLEVHTFAQVNSAAAEGLFGVARAFAAPKKSDVLLDLYCGGGVIGLSMARDCERLIGVEVVPQAVESARQSAAAMGLENTRFICATAGEAAAQLAAEGLRPDIITVDPPRKGADDAALQAMLYMAPRRIVMVSCNPATLARDLAALVKGGYRVQKVQPADMFPRTRHVECVALLEKT